MWTPLWEHRELPIKGVHKELFVKEADAIVSGRIKSRRGEIPHVSAFD